LEPLASDESLRRSFRRDRPRFLSFGGYVPTNAYVAGNAGGFTLTRRVSNRRIPPFSPVFDERFVIAFRAKPFQLQRTMASFPAYNSLRANVPQCSSVPILPSGAVRPTTAPMCVLEAVKGSPMTEMPVGGCLRNHNFKRPRRLRGVAHADLDAAEAQSFIIR